MRHLELNGLNIDYSLINRLKNSHKWARFRGRNLSVEIFSDALQINGAVVSKQSVRNYIDLLGR